MTVFSIPILAQVDLPMSTSGLGSVLIGFVLGGMAVASKRTGKREANQEQTLHDDMAYDCTRDWHTGKHFG